MASSKTRISLISLLLGIGLGLAISHTLLRQGGTDPAAGGEQHMGITRINYFQAKAGQAETLATELQGILPLVTASEGNRSAKLMTDHNDPNKFIIVEEWDSIETHQAATRTIPPEAFAVIMQLLEGPPSGAYYRE